MYLSQQSKFTRTWTAFYQFSQWGENNIDERPDEVTF